MRFEVRAWAGRLLPVAIAVIVVAVVDGQKEQQQKPFAAYHFTVEINGENISYPFRSASGLKIETAVIEYQEGGSDIIRKLAGPTRYANIRLTRAFTGDRSLFDWYAGTKKPNPAKVNGRIIMFDQQGMRIAAWDFTSGFPVKWEGPDFDASKNEVAVETIEIAHEGLTFAPEGGN